MAHIEVNTDVVDLADLRRAGVPVELPPAYGRYVVAVQMLQRYGVWEWLKGRVLDRRAGAYELIDLVAFLLCFFTSAPVGMGLKEFAQESSLYGPELAGVVDRLRWMSQGSLSRSLQSIDLPLGRSVALHLLQSSCRPARAHELVMEGGYVDGQGESWEVFHWDTTVTPMRKRALPEAADLPPPIRDSDGLTALGYPGRKRSDVQFSRSVVSEASTALWVEIDIQPGNGVLRELLKHAADAVVTHVENDEARMARSVVVSDGVAGGLVQARELQEAGLMYLTRSNKYGVLERPSVATALSERAWHDVADSLSGPKRQAVELGPYHIADDIQSRLVVSRFLAPSGRKKRGAGRQIGAWVYEMFITDLPADRWAAADIVTLYYGRTAVENRFAAENREFGLHRVFSYNGAGQLLASGVAMMVWNMDFVAGLHAVPAGAVERPVRVRAPGSGVRIQTPRAQSVEELMRHWCNDHAGWNCTATPSLVCPMQKELYLSAVVAVSEQTQRLRFRPTSNACRDCPKLSTCMPRATSISPRKEVVLSTAERPLEPPPALPGLIPAAPILRPAYIRRRTKTLAKSIRVSVITPTLMRDEQEPAHTAITDAERQHRRLTIAQRVAINAHPSPDAVRMKIRAGAEALAWFGALQRQEISDG